MNLDEFSSVFWKVQHSHKFPISENNLKFQIYLTAAIITVLQLPPSESFSNRVSFWTIIGRFRFCRLLVKIVERTVHKQLSEFLDINNILHPNQSGFRPMHSTNTVLMKLVSQWSLNIENKQLTGVAFVDLRKAFDTSAVVDRPFGERIGDKTAILRKYDMSTEILFWRHE